MINRFPSVWDDRPISNEIFPSNPGHGTFISLLLCLVGVKGRIKHLGISAPGKKRPGKSFLLIPILFLHCQKIRFNFPYRRDIVNHRVRNKSHRFRMVTAALVVQPARRIEIMVPPGFERTIRAYCDFYHPADLQFSDSLQQKYCKHTKKRE